MKNRFEALLSTLLDFAVDFVLVGGVAAAVHGSVRATFDLDIVYDRSPVNLDRIVRALEPLEPYLRGAPLGLPFRLDVPTLERGLNFALTTRFGELDLLGEIVGGGRYKDLVAETVLVDLFGRTCRCLSLRKLIEVKRAAGRLRDLDAVAELEALAEESGAT